MNNFHVPTEPNLSPASVCESIPLETFDRYQRFTERTISKLSTRITLLEQELNVFTNLLEISQYINQNVKRQDLFPLINDMLIGVFGTRFATIYIKSEGNYLSTTPAQFSYPDLEAEKSLILSHHETSFIINSPSPIYPTHNFNETIYSCLGVPITINEEMLGFIIIQHQQPNYFTKQHQNFLLSLANHIAIAVENNILYNQIKEYACRDGLTNVFNKRYFFDTLNALPNLEALNYAIVMIDLDNFKAINDTYGHPFGDEVLKVASDIIRTSTRPKDIVARYGGEEIIIFLHEFTNLELLRTRLESLRLKIEQTVITFNNESSSVTASFGCYAKANELIPLDEAIKKADENLYICKRTGKNKICINGR